MPSGVSWSLHAILNTPCVVGRDRTICIEIGIACRSITSILSCIHLLHARNDLRESHVVLDILIEISINRIFLHIIMQGPNPETALVYVTTRLPKQTPLLKLPPTLRPEGPRPLSAIPHHKTIREA